MKKGSFLGIYVNDVLQESMVKEIKRLNEIDKYRNINKSSFISNLLISYFTIKKNK